MKFCCKIRENYWIDIHTDAIFCRQARKNGFKQYEAIKEKRKKRVWTIKKVAKLLVFKKKCVILHPKWNENRIKYKYIQRWKEHFNPTIAGEWTSTVSVREWLLRTVAECWLRAAPKAARSWPSPTSATASNAIKVAHMRTGKAVCFFLFFCAFPTTEISISCGK